MSDLSTPVTRTVDGRNHLSRDSFWCNMNTKR